MVIKVDIYFFHPQNIWDGNMDGKMDSKKDQPFFWADRYIYFFSPHDTGLVCLNICGDLQVRWKIIILCIQRWQVVGFYPPETDIPRPGND